MLTKEKQDIWKSVTAVITGPGSLSAMNEWKHEFISVVSFSRVHETLTLNISMRKTARRTLFAIVVSAFPKFAGLTGRPPRDLESYFAV